MSQKPGPLGNMDSCSKVILSECEAFKVEWSLGAEDALLLKDNV